MIERGGRATGPARNDINEGTLPRETLRGPQDGELTRLGEILPTVLARIVDRIETDVDYPICEHCHRPSWGHVAHLIGQARRDERALVELEERLASMELTARERLASLDLAKRLLQPRPKGERRYLRVSA